MSYLPHPIQSRKNKQYIAPRLGIDLPYWNKYFSYQEGFDVVVYGYFDGECNTADDLLTSDDVNLEEYDEHAYCLIGEDGTDYGEITSITYVPGTLSVVEVESMAVFSGTESFAIVKRYESLITQPPTKSISSKRYGELMRVGEMSFSLNNIEEYETLEGSYGSPSEEIMTYVSGDTETYSEAYVGSMCHLQQTSGGSPYDGWHKIVDVYPSASPNPQIKISPGIPAASTGYSYDVKIIDQQFLSDELSALRYIEESPCQFYLYFGDNYDDEVFFEDNGYRWFDGKVKYFDIQNLEEIDFTVYEDEEFLNRDTIGELIESADSAAFNARDTDAIGETKPILYGVSEGNTPLGDNYEVQDVENNYAKLKYMGIDPTTNKKVYLAAGHPIDYTYSSGNLSSPTIYYKNSDGRLCEVRNEISPGGYTVPNYDTGTNQFLISFGVLSPPYDRWLVGVKDYVKGSSYYGCEISHLEDDPPNWEWEDTLFFDYGVGGYENNNIRHDGEEYLLYAVNNEVGNMDYHIKGSSGFIRIDNDYGDATHPPEVWYYISFSPLGDDVYEIISNDVKAVFYICEIGGGTPASSKMEINGANMGAAPVEDKSAGNFGTHPNTKAGVEQAVKVLCGNDYSGTLDGTNELRVYAVWKELFLLYDLHANDMEFFVAFSGNEYGSWVNNRTAGKTSTNGGFYLYTHGDDGDEDGTIENPVGIIESILRNSAFGCGLSSSKINLDAFNRASAARSLWKNCFQIQGQINTESLLAGLCEENALVLGNDRDGRTSIWAYESDAPFSYNTFGGDGNDYLTLKDGSSATTITWGDGMTIKTRVYFNDFTYSQSLCGNRDSDDYIWVGDVDTTRYIYFETGGTTQSGVAFPFETEVWYDLELVMDGGAIKVYVDESYIGSTGSAFSDMTIGYILSGFTTSTNYILDGKMDYFTILDADEVPSLDVVGWNEKPVDRAENYALYENGTILYDLSDRGIYDFNAYTKNEEFVTMPILEGSFSINKITDELANDITFRYYKNNDTGEYQSSYNEANTNLSTTIEKEVNLDYISDTGTVERLATIMLDANGEKRAYAITFETNACGVGLDMFEVINVRHPLIRGMFSDMKTKKWVVCGLRTEADPFKIKVTVVELL